MTRLQIQSRSIILGDFNAHHTWWNAKITSNIRAEALTTWLEQAQCELLNTPDQDTYIYNQGQSGSVLDLTFATPQLRPFLTNWNVNSALATGSDHEVIQFTLQAKKVELVESPLTGPYNLQKADWSKFFNFLQQGKEEALEKLDKLLQSNKEEDLEQGALVLQNLISKALENSVPRRRPSARSKAWWTQNLTTLRHQMSDARRISKQERILEAW